jgi:hypothetical protein
MMKSILFFSLFLLFFFALHYLFHTRVIKKLLFREKVKQFLSVSLWINFILNLLYVVERYSDLLPGRLYYLFSLSIGVSFILLLYLVVHEVLEVFHRSIKYLDHSKRRFFKKSGDTALLALSTSYLGAAAYEGSKFPVIEAVKFGKFDFSIVQVSDFHIGGLIDRDFSDMRLPRSMLSHRISSVLPETWSIHHLNVYNLHSVNFRRSGANMASTMYWETMNIFINPTRSSPTSKIALLHCC